MADRNHMTGGELAEDLARLCAGTFGGRTLTDEQAREAADVILKALAEHLVGLFDINLGPSAGGGVS